MIAAARVGVEFLDARVRACAVDALLVARADGHRSGTPAAQFARDQLANTIARTCAEGRLPAPVDVGAYAVLAALAERAVRFTAERADRIIAELRAEQAAGGAR